MCHYWNCHCHEDFAITEMPNKCYNWIKQYRFWCNMYIQVHWPACTCKAQTIFLTVHTDTYTCTINIIAIISVVIFLAPIHQTYCFYQTRSRVVIEVVTLSLWGISLLCCSPFIGHEWIGFQTSLAHIKPPSADYAWVGQMGGVCTCKNTPEYDHKTSPFVIWHNHQVAICRRGTTFDVFGVVLCAVSRFPMYTLLSPFN